MRETISFVIAIEVIKRISTSSHYSIKLLEIEHSISISISFFKHFLQLLIRDFLSDFACNSFEIFEGYFIEIIFIKKFEDL